MLLRVIAIVCAITALACSAQASAAAAPDAAAAAGPTAAPGLTKPLGRTSAPAPRRASGCDGADVIALDEPSRRRAKHAVLCLVNRERAARRIAILRVSSSLARAAARYSTSMVQLQYFAHRSPAGDDVRRRAARTGYRRHGRATLLGETLAWGRDATATPTELVTTFMRSPGHRRTMLSRRYRDIGVGLALGAPAPDATGNAATLTIDFGRR